MTDRTIIYRADALSEAAETVSQRLKASGVNIIDERPDMLLVSGAQKAIDKIVDATDGWSASAETLTPLPDTEFSIKGPPED